MSSVNQVTLLGNLGNTPDVVTFQNGGQIARLSLATSERWMDQKSGEWREHTEWHSVILRGRAIELYVPRLQKGTKVFVQGSIRSNRYTDKNGVERTSYEINADTIKIISGGVEQQQQQQNHTYQKGGYNQNQGYQQQQPQQQWNNPQAQQQAWNGQQPQQQGNWQQQQQAPQQQNVVNPKPATPADEDIPF